MEKRCIAQKDFEFFGTFIKMGTPVSVKLHDIKGKKIYYDIDTSVRYQQKYVEIVLDDNRIINLSMFSFLENFKFTYLRSKTVEIIEPLAFSFWLKETELKTEVVQLISKDFNKWKVKRILMNNSNDGRKLRILSTLDKELIYSLWYQGYRINVISHSMMTTLCLSAEVQFYVENWYAYNGLGALEKIRALNDYVI